MNPHRVPHCPAPPNTPYCPGRELAVRSGTTT
ncbi:hypothetical protein STRAU_0496 [Streptomyces aurantiacus JA 4570]|uniref:Uncharacterized protein n=1 Tax=Streptomyces aurantiacus JA 4570 TaxID=1286094 RepID=S3ZUR5_9ACTN|nr:hypothetical protein STRAU_0496 [Streptomyces aurantiacus JA 4570]